MYILPIIGVIGKDFKYKDLLMHLNAAKDDPIVKLIINSPGGDLDEAGKMYDALEASKKTFFSINSGDVASAAVELFLIAPAENRSFNPKRGEFLIHNPFVQPEPGATATADELQIVSDDLKALEKGLVKMYSKKTGSPELVLEGFMKENTPLTPDQIKSLGFANIIEEAPLKAVALYKQKTDMENKEIVEKLSGFEAAFNKFLALFGKAKALKMQDTNGKELDFGEAVQDPAQIVPGITATVDGSPAEGEFPMPDGSILVFAAGALTEIKSPVDNELAKAKKEVEDLKAQIAAKDAEMQAFKTEAESMKKVAGEFAAFKAQFSKGKEGTDGGDPGSGGEGGDKTRKAFKVKS